VSVSKSDEEIPRNTPDRNKQLFSITFLKANPESVKYFTGFQSYDHFMYLYNGLSSKDEGMTDRHNHLIPEDQLFLTLIKLRRTLGFVHLGHVFGINKSEAFQIFLTWLDFLYLHFKGSDMWLSRKVIDETMPKDFKSKYPNARVILGVTEIPIRKPSNLKDQKLTWSNIKKKNTLKTVVGISPRGHITFISETFGGSATGREILEKSYLLKPGMFETGDVIVAKKNLIEKDVFVNQDVVVSNPPTCKSLPNLSPSKNEPCDPKSSKPVRVERVIRLAKTFKILKTELHHFLTPHGGKIIYVCFSLCNFKPCVVPDLV